MDLIQTSNTQFEKMWELINSITGEEQRGAFEFEGKEAHWKRDKNIRDIFIHLYEWHQLLLNWVDSNQEGVKRQFLQDGYNWKTYGEMNVEFWEKHQNTTYEKSVKILEKSHMQVMKLVEQFSNDKLFSKGSFEWVVSSTLGSYFVSVTSSHYDWAMKKIKRYKKELGE